MLKSRDITLPIKVSIVKAMVFPAVIHSCESWTIKKVEHQRTDAFKLWCWTRLLRDPWTARRLNNSTIREINPEYSLKGLMLKLKLQYFGHLMWIVDSLEKSLMLGMIEGRKRRGMAGWHHQSNDMLEQSLELVRNREAWCAVIHGVTKNWTWLGDWTPPPPPPTLGRVIYRAQWFKS